MTGQRDYTVLEEKLIPITGNALGDQLIQFTGLYAQKDCPLILRRGVVWDSDNEREIVLLTNHLQFGANTVEAIYKGLFRTPNFLRTQRLITKLRFILE